MNKNAIKNFSIWARRKLIADVAYRAGLMGITPEGIAKPLPQSTQTTEFYDIGTKDPYILTGDAISQRRRLVDTIRRKERDTNYATAYKYILEEVAYTWFNRLIAIRFMEVNDYLPSHVRVLSSESGKLEPDLVTKPFDTDLVFSSEETEEIRRLHEAGDVDALFQLLFIKQCNALHEILPRLFERTSDVTELLFRVSVVDPEGVVYKLVHDIPEKDFNIEKDGQVEIIGWLYQYYNTEPKNEAFAKNGKISKEEIPAVTQLFTPDWIVRYMVENSLGRVVINNLKYDIWAEEEKAKIDVLQSKWKYYIDEAEQTPEVDTELRILEHNKYASGEQLPFVDTTFLDPCMGSGHILVYAFDVFMDIYRVMGWSDRDAAQRIIQKNLYGLDIDERAAQLAYFSLMMKARQYDRRFFTRNLQPNVYSAKGYPEGEEFGSLITVDELEPAPDFDHWTLHDGDYQQALNRWSFRFVLAQKYDVVVTNPPYMGGNNMDAGLSEFVKANYWDSKSDLFACFIERCSELLKQNGYQAMITQQSFLFSPTFTRFRDRFINNKICNLIHIGFNTFPELNSKVALGVAFILFPTQVPEYVAQFFDLNSRYSPSYDKEMAFFQELQTPFLAKCSMFTDVPNHAIAYSFSPQMLAAFSTTRIAQYIVSDGQTKTGDNDKYIRKIWEVDNTKIGKEKKWALIAKGGDARKWYGNIFDIIDWSDTARMHYKTDKVARIAPKYIWFRKGICWNHIATSKGFATRLLDDNTLFETASPAVLVDDEVTRNVIMAFLNTPITRTVMELLNPSVCKNVGDITGLPLINLESEQKRLVSSISKENQELAKEEWDSYETSWGFAVHPIVRWSKGLWDATAIGATMHFFYGGHPKVRCPLELCYMLWRGECNERFKKLKANEEELNRIFIDIYGLQEELTPEVEDKDVTVRRADLGRDIRSLISYAVGCMFGRYSLDVEGLAFAGGEFREQWTVVSGQCYRREVVENYVSQQLQSAYGMAEVDGAGGGGLPTGEAASPRGVICAFRTNAAGGSVHSVQYRRGTTAKLYEGIQELSLDRERFQWGITDPAYDLCSPEILDAISNGNGDGLVRRGWKDADRIDWAAVHCQLTTVHYPADEDNVIPITDEAYLEDDIVTRFVEFIRTVYGSDSLEDNLDFISKALGKKGGSSREVIRNYFLNDFFNDHCQTYSVTGSGKRPIYWLFDSGKQNGFKALIYLHRYTPDTVGTLRVDYLHRLQRVYESEIDRMQDMIDSSANSREIAAATKRKEKLIKQLKECRDYDEKLAHLALARIELDLDDGVKVNYRKLQTTPDGKFYEVLAQSKNIMAKEK